MRACLSYPGFGRFRDANAFEQPGIGQLGRSACIGEIGREHLWRGHIGLQRSRFFAHHRAICCAGTRQRGLRIGKVGDDARSLGFELRDVGSGRLSKVEARLRLAHLTVEPLDPDPGNLDRFLREQQVGICRDHPL